MVYYYNYYTSGYLSKAYNHQNYAKHLYNKGMYRYAIYHSNLARRYALTIIYECDNYWDNFYRPYYYRNYSNFYNGRYYRYYGSNRPGTRYYSSSPGRPNDYGHPKGYSNAPGNKGSYGHNTNVQGGVNNGSGINATSRFTYSSEDRGLKNKDFESWNKSYYTTEESSLITDMPTEKELTTLLSSLLQDMNNIVRIRLKNNPFIFMLFIVIFFP